MEKKGSRDEGQWLKWYNKIESEEEEVYAEEDSVDNGEVEVYIQDENTVSELDADSDYGDGDKENEFANSGPEPGFTYADIARKYPLDVYMKSTFIEPWPLLEISSGQSNYRKTKRMKVTTKQRECIRRTTTSEYLKIKHIEVGKHQEKLAGPEHDNHWVTVDDIEAKCFLNIFLEAIISLTPFFKWFRKNQRELKYEINVSSNIEYIFIKDIVEGKILGESVASLNPQILDQKSELNDTTPIKSTKKNGMSLLHSESNPEYKDTEKENDSVEIEHVMQKIDCSSLSEGDRYSMIMFLHPGMMIKVDRPKKKLGKMHDEGRNTLVEVAEKGCLTYSEKDL
ncbi:hypothetical protein JTB14_022061 [Gonioctena quinquepunctata]|nr:hypothetical protein JTB14_022061 [Gonioctena quinquepunctata]